MISDAEIVHEKIQWRQWRRDRGKQGDRERRAESGELILTGDKQQRVNEWTKGGEENEGERWIKLLCLSLSLLSLPPVMKEFFLHHEARPPTKRVQATREASLSPLINCTIPTGKYA